MLLLINIKYYFEMVVDNVFYHDQPTITSLFRN